MTTHHLDEADILADRIAVLSNGKLLTYGTSNYIKRNFGEGYVLKFISINGGSLADFKVIKDAANSILSEVIPAAQRNLQQCSSECETYIIPFSFQKNFPELFEKLEIYQKTMPFNVTSFIMMKPCSIIYQNKTFFINYSYPYS